MQTLYPFLKAPDAKRTNFPILHQPYQSPDANWIRISNKYQRVGLGFSHKLNQQTKLQAPITTKIKARSKVLHRIKVEV